MQHCKTCGSPWRLASCPSWRACSRRWGGRGAGPPAGRGASLGTLKEAIWQKNCDARGQNIELGWVQPKNIHLTSSNAWMVCLSMWTSMFSSPKILINPWWSIPTGSRGEYFSISRDTCPCFTFFSRAVIFKSGCFVQKYWPGTVTRDIIHNMTWIQ